MVFCYYFQVDFVVTFLCLKRDVVLCKEQMVR